MPYTPAQIRLFHAAAEGQAAAGPPPAAARRMLAEHAPVRTDVNKTGHATKRRRRPRARSSSAIRRAFESVRG